MLQAHFCCIYWSIYVFVPACWCELRGPAAAPGTAPPGVRRRQSGEQKTPSHSPEARNQTTQLNTHNHHAHTTLHREMRKHLVDTGPCFDELTDHDVLSIITGQMERGVAVAVYLIDLCKRRKNIKAFASYWRENIISTPFKIAWIFTVKVKRSWHSIHTLKLG